MNSTANSGTGNQDQSAESLMTYSTWRWGHRVTLAVVERCSGISGIPMVLRSCVLGSHLLPLSCRTRGSQTCQPFVGEGLSLGLSALVVGSDCRHDFRSGPTGQNGRLISVRSLLSAMHTAQH